MALIFNRPLLFAGGSVSEFSAYTQPHHMVFRILDVISGLCLAAGFGLMLTQKIIQKRRFWPLLGIGSIVLGISNCVDALFPLPCSGTKDAFCNAPVRINWQRISLPDHAFSSTVIAVCFFLIPIAAIWYSKKVPDQKLRLLAWSAFISLLVFFGALATANPFMDNLTGISQEIQLLLFSSLVIYLAKVAPA